MACLRAQVLGLPRGMEQGHSSHRSLQRTTRTPEHSLALPTS